MLQLFPDLFYHIGAIRMMGGGGYQRVKMSRRLSEGGIVVREGGWANVWRGDVRIQLSCISK